MPTALLSVSDKEGIVAFARELAARGWRLVSTGGTGHELERAGVPVGSVSDLTGFPEILAGRVKTLHPAVHGGILARRSVASDAGEIEAQGIEPIDLVAVNLYPFRKTVARPGVTLADALDQVDIGGPALLRAAAKNHAFVWPVCDPADYDRVLDAMEVEERSRELRRALAAKVFRHTATYDAAISAYLDPRRAGRPEDGGPPFPEELLASLVRVQELRYGENPDQEAAFYRRAAGEPWGIPALEQLHGKELSYNNLLDVDGALGAIAPFLGEARAACAILKHTTPCGLAVGRSMLDAYERALACDPASAFGSVVIFNQPVTESVAEALAEAFVECLVAPGYATGALRILQRKKNLRILRPRGSERLPESGGHLWPGLETRGVRGGLLVQSAPAPAWAMEVEAARVATARRPTPEEWDSLAFAWAAIQSVKSNAILLAREGATIGIGAGQMSRVDAVRLAVGKAGEAGHRTEGATLASDAFFPFRDGIDAAAAAGVAAVVQPGGSIRDEEVIEAADEHGIAMVLTGRRVFRH